MNSVLVEDHLANVLQIVRAYHELGEPVPLYAMFHLRRRVARVVREIDRAIMEWGRGHGDQR